MTNESSSTNYVFLYGTLKSGFPNSHLNPAVRIEGAFSTVEPYPFYLVGEYSFPWLLDRPGDGYRMRGELYSASEEDLEHFDKLERVGEPEGYLRKSIQVVEADSKVVFDAFIYVIPQDRLATVSTRRGPLPEYTPEDAAAFRIPDDWLS